MSDGGAPPLAIDRLGRRYGATLALHDATLAFERGTIHAILGENGSGKSTLVKLLAGVVAPSEGRVLLDGVPLAARGPGEVRRRGIGTVFQEVLIAPDRSVADNVLLGCDMLWRRDVPRGLRAARAAELLAEVAGRPIDPAARAGGLDLPARQLVVIARALALAPRILVLDEVTAALDHAERERVFTFMQTFASRGGLALFITHRMDEVTRLADRVTVLRNGRLVRTLARAEVTVATMLDLMMRGTLAEAA